MAVFRKIISHLQATLNIGRVIRAPVDPSVCRSTGFGSGEIENVFDTEVRIYCC